MRDVTTKQLREWDIRYGRLYLFKPLGVVEHLCPYPELDWYQKYIWQKIHYCRKELVASFYEDEDKVIELFRSHAPEINIIDSKELFNQSLPTRMLS